MQQASIFKRYQCYVLIVGVKEYTYQKSHIDLKKYVQIERIIPNQNWNSLFKLNKRRKQQQEKGKTTKNIVLFPLLKTLTLRGFKIIFCRYQSGTFITRWLKYLNPLTNKHINRNNGFISFVRLWQANEFCGCHVSASAELMN